MIVCQQRRCRFINVLKLNMDLAELYENLVITNTQALREIQNSSSSSSSGTVAYIRLELKLPTMTLKLGYIPYLGYCLCGFLHGFSPSVKSHEAEDEHLKRITMRNREDIRGKRRICCGLAVSETGTVESVNSLSSIYIARNLSYLFYLDLN